jgi:hypothetical protein
MSELNDKIQELLALDWEEEDKTRLEVIIKNLLYYKSFISKASEKDIIYFLDFYIQEKRCLEELRKNTKEKK